MINEDKVLKIVNEKNIKFNVVLNKDEENKFKITFYDTRHKHSKYGQQCFGSYYADTLIGKGFGTSIKDKALSLYGAEPEWTISAKNSNQVIEFIENNIN